MEEINRKEGWAKLPHSRKWHYFSDDWRSLCGHYLMFRLGNQGYELGNDESADNCAACKRKLAKRKEKAESAV